MANELIVREQENMDVFRLGEVMSKSGFFPSAKDATKAVVKILAGREMGIAPVAAMMGIHVITTQNGTSIQVGANLLASLVKSHPRYDYRVTRHDDNACVIEFFQDGKPIGVSSFSKADAEKAGTKNMGKFPRNMLFARAMSNGVKWYCPDVTAGITAYVPGEVPQEAITNLQDLPPAETEDNNEDVQQGEPEQPAPKKAVDPDAPIGQENAQLLVEYAKSHGWAIPHLFNACKKHYGNKQLSELTRDEAKSLQAHMRESYAAKTTEAPQNEQDTPPPLGNGPEGEPTDAFSDLEGSPDKPIGEEAYCELRTTAKDADIDELQLIAQIRLLLVEKLLMKKKDAASFNVYYMPESLMPDVIDWINEQAKA